MNPLIAEILNIEKDGTIEAILSFDKKLDAYFGLDISTVEAHLESCSDDAYIGLDFRALLTSYIDYYNILKRIPKHETIVDLGAGYCRGTLLSQYLNLARCVSYEFVPERTYHAQKFLSNLTSANLIFTESLETALLPEAYAYYLYFPRGEVLDIVLRKMIKISEQREIILYACEAHGDLIEYLKGLECLKPIEEFKCNLPRHYVNIVSFRVVKPNFTNLSWKNNLALWLLLNPNKESDVFIINYFHIGVNKNVKWLVPVKKTEWIMYQGSECLLVSQGRIIEINKHESIIGIETIDTELRNYFNNKHYKKVFLNGGQYMFETI